MSSSTNSQDGSSASDPPTNEVQTELLKEISQMSVEELTELEQQLSSEFKTIGKEYLESRLSRISVILEKLNNLIKLATANDKSWLKIYNFEVETINNIMTNTEDLIMVNNGTLKNKPDLLKSIDEYQEELKEIFKNLQSPFDFDNTFKYDNEYLKNHGNINNNLSKLPFPYLFNDYFKRHRDGLHAISKEKDYQTKLIKDNLYGNRIILWKQYYSSVNQKKQILINKTQHELNQLYKDYYRLNEYKNTETSNRAYYRSLYTPFYIDSLTDDKIDTINTKDVGAVLNSNHDSNYVELDTRYRAKNKIELSHIRRNIKSKDWEVSNIANNIKRAFEDDARQEETEICSGLNDFEADQDLSLIRENIRDAALLKKRRKVMEDTTDESELYSDEEGEAEDEDNGLADSSEDGDLEECEEVEELSPEEKLKRKEYKQVLFGDGPVVSTLERLPPLESFPALYNYGYYY
ncbi:hypothetical protein Cantr_05568 [Candida viswanathii]|uniref:Uncharacterized protein n=1 Tax=Candida viswanathii TaxID=5486 RepID=A0A367XQ23_9ASCO|nr:hypothetical protein Cantr_05568 [Candida viswanathii]